MKTEKNWINYLKWFCLFFIFLNHSEIYSGCNIPYYSRYIAPFYVSAFFFISGYFLIGRIINQLNQQSDFKTLSLFYKNNLKNIVFRLIITSIIFSVVEFLPAILIRGGSFEFKNFLFKTIGGGTYWFVSALTVAELIIILLPFTKIKNVWFYFGVSICIYIAACFLVKYNVYFVKDYPDFPWYFKKGLLAFFFIGFGGLFYCYEKHIEKLFKLPIVILLLISYILLFTFFGGTTKFPEIVKMFNIFESIMGLIIIMVLIYFFKLIKGMEKPFKFANFEGRHSIGLYFMSGASPAVFGFIFSKVIPTGSPLLLICVFAFSFSFANVINYVLIKFAPFLFDLRKLKKPKNPI